MALEHTCKDCVYWIREECRRYPPKSTPTYGGMYRADYPRLPARTPQCGEGRYISPAEREANKPE